MNHWDSKRPDLWAQLLGMVAVPMFAPQEATPRRKGKHFLMLDGLRGSFVLSTAGPKSIIKGNDPVRWAWSANARHSVAVNETGEVAIVRRWDAPDDLEERPVRRESDARALLKSFEKSPQPPIGQSVIDRGLETFRAVRTAIEKQEGGSARDVVLTFNTLLAWVAELSDTDPDREVALEDAIQTVHKAGRVGFTPEQISRQLFNFPLGNLARLLREGNSRSAQYLLDARLLIRHASGPLYQEAHKQLLVPGSRQTLNYELFPEEMLIDGREAARAPAPSFVHHTPPSLARALVEVALEHLETGEESENLDILDPACGSGVFLIEAIREIGIRRGLPQTVSLRGFDKSELAAEMADFCLRNANAESSDHTLTIQRQNSLTVKDWGSPHIIAMNPPFVSWEALDEYDRSVVDATLGLFHEGRPDLAFAFIVRALKSLRPGGVMAALVPPSFLEGRSARSIRAHLLESGEFKIRLIGHFNDFKYFDATVEPSFIVVSRSEREKPIQIVTATSGFADKAIRALRRGVSLTRAGYELYNIAKDELLPDRLTPLPQRSLRFIQSLSANTPYTVADFFIPRLGVRVGNKPVFMLAEDELEQLCPTPEERRFFRPIADRIEVGQIQPSGYVFYPYDTDGKLLLRTEQELKRSVPRFYNARLLPNKRVLEDRVSYRKWWELTRPVATWLAARTPRIVSQSFGRAGNFAFDREGRYAVVQGVGWCWKHGVPNEDLMLAYLGLLNSDVFDEVLSCFCPRVSGGQYNLTRHFIERVPLPSLADSGVRVRLSQIGRAIVDGRAYDHRAQNYLVLLAYGIKLELRRYYDDRPRVVGSGEQETHLQSSVPGEQLKAPTPIDVRIAEIAELREGWFGPGSPPLDPNGLRAFKVFLNSALVRGRIPAPYIYPTPDGGAQAEWSFPTWEVSATASLKTGELYLHATHLESDQSRTAETTLATAEAVDDFLKFMSEFTG